ncbi:TetR/AcrR family transcriptional regulator [Amycolatopsis nigrescens]|uniref:TetR/AcrR family transcriptional regulator n=1 Tax=Amycolatopsis nigrescens TaxID=381445 RepID=UPI00036B45FE|nr:TetR family transcriptional regulator [Amycolatopsis nigrescens]
MQNPERRVALTEAAVEVLAREGARGLTFRAVDTEAKVPAGTASNYFANREELLHQAALRIYQRVGAGPAELADAMAAEPSVELVTELMRGLFQRISTDRTGFLALQELRLEATRRPRLQAALTETISADVEANIRFHLDAGLPGDRETVLLLYFAMTALIVEHLTLPDVLAPFPVDDLIAMFVHRAIPTTP